ncbi:hypothetical protein KEJ27_10470, partial [Candidatus Bathyarchaeota archaeon]|nr:hypothetical protein [Candidatus Bathyarchaeota archaeon]
MNVIDNCDVESLPDKVILLFEEFKNNSVSYLTGGRLQKLCELPYRFSVTEVGEALYEKILSRKLFIGILSMIRNFSSYQKTKHVIEGILLRRRRETY